MSRPFRVGEYILHKKLGSGSFGDIYKGKHHETEQEVAIKMERATSQHLQLNHEYKVYKVLKSNESILNCSSQLT